jgi:hypothetical protein
LDGLIGTSNAADAWLESEPELAHTNPIAPRLELSSDIKGWRMQRKAVPGQWAESEVARLRALAQKMPVQDLVHELGRSRGAISAKAFLLRISLDVRKNRADPEIRAPGRRRHG